VGVKPTRQLGLPLRVKGDASTSVSVFEGPVGEERLIHDCSRSRLNQPNRRIRDPYVRWCGRRGVVRPLPIPIIQATLLICFSVSYDQIVIIDWILSEILNANC